MQDNLNISSNESEIFNSILSLKKELKEQKKISDLHLHVFDETLKNLSEDKKTIIEYKKRIDCLLRTTQIFICICIVLFSILFLNVFN
jgi:hypothetical protein